MREDADRLQVIIERSSSWPVWAANRFDGRGAGSFAKMGSYGQSARDLALWVAMREGDREALKEHLSWPRDRKYRHDPLPERICAAYSDLLFGEDPQFIAATDGDQDTLDEMIKENALVFELRRWVDWCVSEGEVWWRVFVDHDLSEFPIIDAASRLDVLPLWRGRRCVAAAFISDIYEQEVKLEKETVYQIWRHIEIQTDGLTRNLLYKGNNTQIGNEAVLGDDPDGLTTGLPPEWNHGLDIMLAGRIPNKLGRDWRLGISEFNGVKDLLLDLNETRTIAAENARLVLKARMVVPSSAMDADGEFNAGKDVIVQESIDTELGGQPKLGPYAVLEHNFQATPLIEHKNELVVDILARCGLAEQFVATKGGQTAYTGTALRTRLIPTTMAANGKGKVWDDALPQILCAMAQVSQLPKEQGGCGITWSSAEKPPTFKRGKPLPDDEAEIVQRHVMSVQGEIESVETAVAALHPEWTEDEVQAEVDRIREDRAGPDPVDVIPLTEPPPTPGIDTPTMADTTGAQQPGVAGKGPKVTGQSPSAHPPKANAGGNK